MNKKFLVDICAFLAFGGLVLFTLYMISGVFVAPKEIVSSNCKSQMPDFMSDEEKGLYCGCAADELVDGNFSPENLNSEDGRRAFFKILENCNSKYFKPVATRMCQNTFSLPDYIRKTGIVFDCGCYANLTQSIFIRDGSYDDLDSSAKLICIKSGSKFFSSMSDVRHHSCLRDIRGFFGKIDSYKRLKMDAYCSCLEKTNSAMKMYEDDGLTIRDNSMYQDNQERCRDRHF